MSISHLSSDQAFVTVQTASMEHAMLWDTVIAWMASLARDAICVRTQLYDLIYLTLILINLII